MLVCREHVTPRFHFFIPRNASSFATSPKPPLLFGNRSGKSSLAGPKHLPRSWYEPYVASREAGSWFTGVRKRPSLQSVQWFMPTECNKMFYLSPCFHCHLSKYFCNYSPLTDLLLTEGFSNYSRPLYPRQLYPLIHAPDIYWAYVWARCGARSWSYNRL